MYWKRSRQRLFTTFERIRHRIPQVFFVLLCLSVFLFHHTPGTHAFPVPELPDDNLIVNPWFRDDADPSAAGLDGWTRVLTNGVGWVTSQKESNPSPTIVVSGRCGYDSVYCGTSARWAKIVSGPYAGQTFPNIDVYLYQVVDSGAQTKELTFFMHWVSHRVAAAEVTIFGSQSPNGPWTQVWVPFFHSQDEVIYPPGGEIEEIWEETGFLETTLGQGFRYYKVQFRANLPEGEGVGFKMTGVYFGTEANAPPPPPEHLYDVYLPLFRSR